ncbi:hypothetical protein BASA83_010317 [Batrachochytrium salamandrivorans]|nr:hypothetical protein BASA83_010317 [Batrachochytrium salamandrivorans]
MPSAPGTDNDVFTLNVQGHLVRSQRWFWSRRTKQAIQEQILADTTESDQRQSSNDTRCIDGDSCEHVETLHRSKSIHSTIIGHFRVLQGSQFSSNREHMHKISDACAHGCSLEQARKAIQIGILVDTHPFSVDHCILCDQQLLSTSICSSRGGV